MIGDILFLLREGLKITLLLAAVAIGIGTVIGSFVGWLRTVANAFFDNVILIFLDTIRSTPLIIQLFIAYHLPAFLGLRISTLTAGSAVVVLYFAANTSQVVKSGIESVDSAQWRGAKSLGFSYIQQMRLIILPQAWRTILPSYTGFALGIIKDTSLVSVIGVTELVGAGEIVISRTLDPLPIWLTVAIIYFVICWPISKFSNKLEERVQII